VTTAPSCEWADFIVPDYTFADYPPGARVLDVGFGTGDQLRTLNSAGCTAIGLESDGGLAARARSRGLAVCQGVAEALPFAGASFDGVICKVVIPYTDEARALAEIARTLRPGGIARISYHGVGYSFRYLFTDPNWKRRVYAARVIVNTSLYALTGNRLPGFWGDTLYQSERRLRTHYEAAGLELVESRPAPRFAGAPVFIYHTLRRR
jgi:SAM-dependent methyltransferase